MSNNLPSVLRCHESADAVMARHATTFSWANRMMPRAYAKDFAILYAFCRLADDVVDEASDPAETDAALAILREGLERGSSEVPAVAEFLELSARRSIPLEIPRQLLIGVASDRGAVRIADRGELLRYAYRVASTVGLMVCHIVDLRLPEAHAHAIDLGIAMQLTNICRDVIEDAKRDRIYLPADMVSHGAVFEAVQNESAEHRQRVYAVILETLDWARQYYRSAHLGIGYLPVWSRLGVITASRCYGAIGGVIHRRRQNYWSGRCFTTKAEKVGRTLMGLTEFVLWPGYWTPIFAGRHDPELHVHLEGLPGAHLPKDAP